MCACRPVLLQCHINYSNRHNRVTHSATTPHVTLPLPHTHPKSQTPCRMHAAQSLARIKFLREGCGRSPVTGEDGLAQSLAFVEPPAPADRDRRGGWSNCRRLWPDDYSSRDSGSRWAHRSRHRRRRRQVPHGSAGAAVHLQVMRRYHKENSHGSNQPLAVLQHNC